MNIPNGSYEELWSYICAGPVISVSATPNCSFISATSVNCDLHLLDLNGEPVWQEPAKLDNEGWATSISADGRLVAVGTANKKPADGTVYVFDQKQSLIWSETIGSPVWGVSLSRDGRYLAVASWSNHVYKYARYGEKYELQFDKLLPSSAGLYGIQLTEDGSACIVASYDSGLFILDVNGNILTHIKEDAGFYNVGIARDTGVIIAGLRDAAALLTKIDFDKQIQTAKLPKLSSRPTCGVDISDDGKLLGLGSFDGRLYMTDNFGKCIWTHETDGEVWSVAMSGDGRFICVGSGDRSVRLLLNRCNSSAISEIHAVEYALEHIHEENMGAQIEIMLDTLIGLYLRYGILEYGVNRLREFRSWLSPSLIRKYIRRLLEADIVANPRHYYSHYLLADVLSEAKELFEAAYHYQIASKEPKYRSKALMEAGNCFFRLKLPAASFSCLRRAREQHLDSDAKRVLFNLARSYEDHGDWSEAARHYELLVSWDAHYRNAWERLQKIMMIAPHQHIEYIPPRTDYTGMTISLLGPDLPREQEVDNILLPVISARTSSELFEEPGLRKRMEAIVSELAEDEKFIRGITKEGLDYTTELYLKYEYLLPEDELKKFLETVNSLFILASRPINTSLDIGAATGRYPSLLTRKGITAYGVDIEEDAMSFANSKKKDSSELPFFFVGDGACLPVISSTFDLVTCMMGTFAHIPKSMQKETVKEILRVLRPSGMIIISTWDVECEHLAFLSMYNEAQKEEIRKNSLSAKEVSDLFAQCGVENIDIIPFCLLPQVVVYDLGLQKLDINSLRMALHIDLAMRGTFPDRHGEMYLAVGTKRREE